MSTLPDTPPSPPPRFLFMNIAAFGRDLLTAWKGMLEWPVLAWLWPKTTVRLWLPDGSQALGLSLHSAPQHSPERARQARFEAVVLPESLLLRRTLLLPTLQAAELLASLTLEVQLLSPFPAAEAIWAHEVHPLESGGLKAHLVLTSYKLIAQHLAASHPQLANKTPEIWLPRVSDPGFVMLPGLGDPRRLRQGKAWRWASALLALMALALAAAIALTPSVHLYLQSQQARLAMQALVKKATPVQAQREALGRSTEQLKAAVELTQTPVLPLTALQLITDALSDDTSLLSLQIQGLKVTLSGQTTNAATLMKQLGNTPGLRDVKAPTPATKPLGAPRESFTIELTLDPTLIKATP